MITVRVPELVPDDRLSRRSRRDVGSSPRVVDGSVLAGPSAREGAAVTVRIATRTGSSASLVAAGRSTRADVVVGAEASDRRVRREVGEVRTAERTGERRRAFVGRSLAVERVEAEERAVCDARRGVVERSIRSTPSTRAVRAGRSADAVDEAFDACEADVGRFVGVFTNSDPLGEGFGLWPRCGG